MSALGNTLENDLLKLLFNATAIANIADNAASSPATNLYVSLHTANPGEAGAQNTSESAYTSYARVAVARTSGGWTISTNSFTNAAEVAFPACTGSTSTVKFFGIGTASSGAGILHWYGPLTGARFAFTFDVTVDFATDKIVAPGHNFVSTSGSNEVVFYGVQGATLPTGITEGTIYFVKTATTDSFTISATDGGSTLNITASGAGFVSAITPLAISNGITPRFAAGAIDGFLD